VVEIVTPCFGRPEVSDIGGGAMALRPRDRIVIDSDKAGQPAREGAILEVIEADYGTRYRVAWDDGHKSTIRPAGGTAHVIHAAQKATPRR
jgi:hypothetical protein